MNLYLLRHGHAENASTDHGGADRFRRLTNEGIKKITRMAQFLRSSDIAFDYILASPYLRTKETAEIIAQTLNADEVLKLTAHLIPEAPLKHLISEITHLDGQNILLVGHEPNLSTLLSVLVSGTETAAITFKKGSIAKLTVSHLQLAKCASLDWLVTPSLVKNAFDP